MNIDRLKELAGIQLNEAVEISGDASIEKLTSMLSAATRALGLANKLTNPEEKKKHLSQVMGNLNKIRGALRRTIKATVQATESVDTKRLMLERQELSSMEVQKIAVRVYNLAESEAFSEAEEGEGVVTGDMIHSKAKAIVKSLPEKIMIHVAEMIEREHD